MTTDNPTLILPATYQTPEGRVYRFEEVPPNTPGTEFGGQFIEMKKSSGGKARWYVDRQMIEEDVADGYYMGSHGVTPNRYYLLSRITRALTRWCWILTATGSS